VENLHPWLGRDYRQLLSTIRKEGRVVGIAVTRPSGRSLGEGALRVLQVRESEQRVNLVLAYERYQYPPDEKGRKGSRRGDS